MSHKSHKFLNDVACRNAIKTYCHISHMLDSMENIGFIIEGDKKPEHIGHDIYATLDLQIDTIVSQLVLPDTITDVQIDMAKQLIEEALSDITPENLTDIYVSATIESMTKDILQQISE